MSVRTTLSVLLLITLAGFGGLPAALAAGPVFWDWPAGRELAAVELQGAALDGQDALVRGLAARDLGPEGPDVFWCMVLDGQGGYYLGTGHGGAVHHTDRHGKHRLVAELATSEVFSLLLLPGGDLLAGCGPEGHLYRIDSAGAAAEVGRIPGGYIWDMVLDPDDGAVWLGAGSPASVWRLGPDGDLAEVRVLAAQNVLDLAWDGKGNLLAATQGPGLVCRFARTGDDPVEVLLEAAQSEVRQVLQGPGGELFALGLEVQSELGGGGTNGNGDEMAAMLQVLNGKDPLTVPRSSLYHLADSGHVVPVWTGDVDLMIAAWSETWGWLGGGALAEDSGRASVYEMMLPAGVRPLANWPGGDVLSLVVGPDRLLAGQAHPGAVTELLAKGPEPHRALSAPVDAGRPVQWGRLRWEGSGDLRWSVRGGNRSQPDETWTAWTGSWRDGDHALQLPPTRFLQWRVEFPDGRDGGRVTGVTVSAWRENLPPIIARFGEERLREVLTGGLMPRGENVTQALRSGLRVEFSSPTRRERRAPADRAAATRPVRTFTWEGADPDGDRLAWDLEYRRVGGEAWWTIITATEETLGSWDTSALPDGAYHVRLTASDEPANPRGQAARTSRELGPLQVDNTAPVVTGTEVRRQDTGFAVAFKVADEGGVLARADAVLPDGSRQRLDPVDRICDSDREEFAVEIPWSPATDGGETGPFHVRVEVWDLAGNVTVVESEVR